jgi:hypothetical protein
MLDEKSASLVFGEAVFEPDLATLHFGENPLQFRDGFFKILWDGLILAGHETNYNGLRTLVGLHNRVGGTSGRMGRIHIDPATIGVDPRRGVRDSLQLGIHDKAGDDDSGEQQCETHNRTPLERKAIAAPQSKTRLRRNYCICEVLKWRIGGIFLGANVGCKSLSELYLLHVEYRS